MPKVRSEPRASIRVVPKEPGNIDILEHLEERIQNAAQAISELRNERDSLKKQLKEAERRLKELKQNETKSSSKDATLKALAKERDGLLQDRQNTIRRVETMLERIQALGLQ